MRIWTIHPKYLDSRGLVAAWREGLLAQKVLAGGTRGYVNHPQLDRFKGTIDPLAGLAVYLQGLAAEARRRGYSFDVSKIGPGGVQGRRGKKGCGSAEAKIGVAVGQIEYEFELLKSKLEARAPELLSELEAVDRIELNAAFVAEPGGIAPWERPLGTVLARLEKARRLRA